MRNFCAYATDALRAAPPLTNRARLTDERSILFSNLRGITATLLALIGHRGGEQGGGVLGARAAWPGVAAHPLRAALSQSEKGLERLLGVLGRC